MSLCRASSVGQKDNVIGEAALDLAQLSALPGPWLSLACHYLGCALATDRAGHGLGNGGTAARASVWYSVAGQAACSLQPGLLTECGEDGDIALCTLGCAEHSSGRMSCQGTLQAQCILAH